MKKIFIILFLITTFFLLSFFEFKLSRKQLLESNTKPGPSITLTIFPKETSVHSSTLISWDIKTSSPSNTRTTSLYYDYESTPSAVTVNDSPDALGYHFHTLDYSQGDFPIPQIFSVNLDLPSAGTVYFRAHTYLNGQHLWTPEYQIKVK